MQGAGAIVSKITKAAAALALSCLCIGAVEAAVPTAALMTSTGAVQSGGSATLTWSSTDATSCTASNAWSGTLAPSGTQSTGPLTKNSTFVLTCSGPDGTSPVDKAGINVVPTAVLTANPTSVASGSPAALSWSSTNASSCTASAGWTGTLATSGTQSTGAVTQTTTYSLTCKGPAGNSSVATATVAVAGAAVPTAALLTSTGAVPSGGAATLTWSSTNATSCTASNAWSGTLAPSGSQSTGPLTKNSTFVLTCSGPGGTSPVDKAGINVVPTAVLSATPTSVESGSPAALTWSSTNAGSCTASGGWSGALAASGTQSTGALLQNSSFSLTCNGPGGNSKIATVAVTVTGAVVPTAGLLTSTGAVPSGGAATLTWSSTNATSCTASNAWSGTLAPSGTQSTGPLTKNSTFVLTCSGPGGISPVDKAGINVVPTAALSAAPTSVASGSAAILSWSSINASSCTASGGWSGTLATNGTLSTGAVTQNTTYSLTCKGPAGNSNVATTTVSIGGGVTNTMTLTPRTAALTVAALQQFTAVVPGGGAAVWSVDGITSGNATVGTINATGLYTAGTAVGTHSVTVVSATDSTQTASATVAITDLSGVYTYHNDLARDGTNVHEFALTTGNVNAANFGKLAACTVDGAIYGQPLWVANTTVGGAKHNVVYVATQHDSLYAFDADASPCVKLWSVSLIDSAHGGLGGETSVPSTLVGVGTGDIQPEIGVNGTPVIDPSSGILYVVSKSVNSTQTTFYQRLHAINLITGNENPGSPTTIAGIYPGSGDGDATVAFNARQENQRAGLALVNGSVYIAWGSHEDSSPWYGWMMSYQYNGASFVQNSVINVTPNTQGGGIWMGGGAPAVDSSNYLYVLTGNGNFDAGNSSAPNNDYGDSLLKLTPALQLSQYFTPSTQLADSQNDKDFGSGGAAILADLPAGNTVTHVLICGGKDGTLYVINRDLLGGFGDPAAVQPIAFGHPIFATSGFWNNNLYLGGVNGPLTAYQLNTSNAQFSLGSSSTHVFGFPGATPSISSGATQNGVVWALDNGSYCTGQSKSCGSTVLYAYNPANLATELWDSALSPADSAGYAVKYTVPTIANGKVYVGTRGNNTGGADSTTSVPGELDIYGLKP
jgi:hypothetical protein